MGWVWRGRGSETVLLRIVSLGRAEDFIDKLCQALRGDLDRFLARCIELPAPCDFILPHARRRGR